MLPKVLLDERVFKNYVALGKMTLSLSFLEKKMGYKILVTLVM